ncbi:MAG: ATP-binding cassette domain-containing protein, partial [Actinobacteria bacterium]|nr:ATP-binding cassette domain-containing protein [Actinomycetota bacterium]
MATLSVRSLRKEYGDLLALDDLNLDVRDGEFFVLLGPSGAGKTTTLKCIAGLETPTAGRVEIDGRDMTDVEPYDRNVAMAFENYALYPQKTVFENMSFPLNSKRHRVSEEERSDAGVPVEQRGLLELWRQVLEVGAQYPHHERQGDQLV